MIVCPHCATSYRIETAALGASGRTVRCVRCQTVWFARPDESAENAHVETLAAELVNAADALAAPMPPQEPAAPDPVVTAERDALEPAPHEAAFEQVAPLADGLSGIPEDRSANYTAPELNADLQQELQAEPQSEPIESPSIIPPIEQLAALPTALPDPNAEDEGESFAARRERLHARRKKQGLRMPSAPVAILMLVAVIATLAAARKTIVQFAPQTASLYARIGLPVNLRGLVFDTVKTTRDTNDGIPVLVVEGTISSTSSSPVDVPRLRFAVRNAAGAELYSWTAVPARTQIAPGEQLPFKSRLASPPAEAQDVSVRFFTRHDVVAGVR
jgi:predicted Zn finger-like uncharacterized protein